MPTPKSPLHALKLDALRRLARLTGQATSENKTATLASLSDALHVSRLHRLSAPYDSDNSFPDTAEQRRQHLGQTSRSDPHARRTGTAGDAPYRVLSIDMGIRNLAYCVVEVDASWASTGAGTKDPRRRPRIRVVEWRRVSLHHGVDSGPTMREATAPGGDGPASDERLYVHGAPRLPGEQPFAPPWMARLAWFILRGLVLAPSSPTNSALEWRAADQWGNLGDDGMDQTGLEPDPAGGTPPDLILIERQRWRSGGSSAVTEWTLRVNTLEAMLWSGLEVMQRADLWRGVGGVRAVDPKRVASFWVPQEKKPAEDDPASSSSSMVEELSEEDSGETEADGADVKKAKRKPRTMNSPEIKAAKIDVVKQWASSVDGLGTGETRTSGTMEGEQIEWTGQAEQTRKAFVAEKKRGGKKVQEGDGADGLDIDPQKTVKKRDDLADCLLQAVAWIRWEENERRVASGDLLGVDKL